MSKFTFLGALVPVLFASCSTMDAVKSSAANATKSVKQFSLTDLRPAKVDVVDVRQKDLKDMPLGKERALAYEEKQKRSFWSFISAGDFKEPTLPTVGSDNFDGFLLPPKEL